MPAAQDGFLSQPVAIMVRLSSMSVCAGRTNLNGACHRRYSDDKIIYRGGRTQNYGGGTCTQPNNCENCNQGFYNDGRGYCSICPSIKHCNYRSCTSVSDNHCEYCEGEIQDKLYWRAYTRHKDKHGSDDSFMKNCIRFKKYELDQADDICIAEACSWRKNSSRCYPGTCISEIASSCNCTEGFGGKHCQTITKDSDIKFALAKFLTANPTDDPVETPEDPNDPIPRETKWTNQVTINHAVLNVTAIFRVNNSAYPPSETGREHFVTGFKYGINNGVLKLTLERDGNITIPPIARGCRVNKELPTPDDYLCRESNVPFNEWNEHLPFQHEDIVTFTLQITNGGYLFYIDRDAYPDNPETAPRIREDYIGRTVTRDFVVQWDLVPPYHQCVENDGLKCSTSPVFTQEVTNKVYVFDRNRSEGFVC
ncbi:unnamed protein product [Mytilus edulis]|uniref:EGF-like domain-containing protein n=1 Tax=Mytilus edulis TaxID=6550 RepID=A0A8S3Q7I8_MYTED|nr:unnamed protein product [Mytilus edulis]